MRELKDFNFENCVVCNKILPYDPDNHLKIMYVQICNDCHCYMYWGQTGLGKYSGVDFKLDKIIIEYDFATLLFNLKYMPGTWVASPGIIKISDKVIYYTEDELKEYMSNRIFL